MSRHNELRNAFVFVSPATLVTLAISALPLLYILYISFGGRNPTLESYEALLSSRLFRASLVNTLTISFWASVISLIIGYVIALHLARQEPRRRSMLMVLVLLPFWTSVLVKCYAFTVILGRSGMINSLLSWLTDTNVQLPLVLNRFGVMVGMVNYLTPFVVFPVLASLLAIDGAIFSAARIMGAKPARIFFTITLPLSLPGIFAALGSIMVMALSFFVIPALLGGPRDAMLSNLVDFYMRETLDWGMASGIGVLLVGMVLIVTIPFALLRNRRVAVA